MTALKIASLNGLNIEKGVPTPPARHKRRDWPLDQMDVGDSFSVEHQNVASVRSAITRQHDKHPGTRFTLRRLEHENRCWRVA